MGWVIIQMKNNVIRNHKDRQHGGGQVYKSAR